MQEVVAALEVKGRLYGKMAGKSVVATACPVSFHRVFYLCRTSKKDSLSKQ